MQAASLIPAKESLEEDGILMLVDYSESYKNAEQDKIQSAYFGHTCFSLFTACVYYPDNQEVIKIPIIVTTESSKHHFPTQMSSWNMLKKNWELKWRK